MIAVSAPGKIHLLGEHTVVYGKPALLATVNLRVSVTLKPLSPVIARNNVTKQSSSDEPPTKIASLKTVRSQALLIARNDATKEIQKIIEPIIKKELHIKTIPPYQLTISSQIPFGAGLGSSAAVSTALIAALLSFLRVDWNLNLINELAYEAEKVFHGNPSGGDNSTVVFGGLIWFRKESPDLKLIQPVPFTIPHKLAKNFVLVNTGKPSETTRQMVELVSSKFKVQSAKFQKIFDHQEQLVKELLSAVQTGNENELIRIIKTGERNLEKIGVVSKFSQKIIREIEKIGGAAKMCGAGSVSGPTGIILAYHKDKTKVEKIAENANLPYFSTSLGVEGVKIESN